MTAGIDGNLYWLLSDLLRITPAGEASVFAVIPGGDPLSLVAGPDNTDLTFGNGAGIFRIFEAENAFLPITINH